MNRDALTGASGHQEQQNADGPMTESTHHICLECDDAQDTTTSSVVKVPDTDLHQRTFLPFCQSFICIMASSFVYYPVGLASFTLICFCHTAFFTLINIYTGIRETLSDVDAQLPKLFKRTTTTRTDR